MSEPTRPTCTPRARRGSNYALLALAITSGAWAVRGCATPTRPDVVRERAARVEPGRAHAWLADLQEQHPRRGSPARPESVAFVVSAFQAAGLSDVREEVFTIVGDRQLRNAIGRIPGKDGSRCVVLAAHHDTVPLAPGAIDDGGAVAALLEASRVLLAGPPPECDLWVISFDGEERGCLGAKQHLAALGDAGRAQVQAALAVELVGWTDDDLVVHTIPHGFAWDAEGISPAWVPDAVRSSAREAGHRVEVGDPLISPFYQATIRVLGVQTGSDAGAYSAQGIPSAMLTGSALTNFYSGYHTGTDDMSRVDPARLDDAAQVIVGAALELSARAALGQTRSLGDAYLCLGPTTVDLVGLIAIALAGAVICLIPAWDLWPRARLAATGLGLSAGIVFVSSCAGSVLCFVVGLPLILAAGVAARLERGRRLILILGLVPFCVEGLLIYVAGASFGFRWWGGALQTAAVLGLAPCYLVTGGALLRCASAPAPAPDPPPTDSAA